MITKPEHNAPLIQGTIATREAEVARITAKINSTLKPLQIKRLAAIDRINQLKRDLEQVPEQRMFFRATAMTREHIGTEIAQAKVELARCDEDIEKARTVGYIPAMLAVKASKEKEIVALRYGRESIRAHAPLKKNSLKKAGANAAPKKRKRWPDPKPLAEGADTSPPPGISAGPPPFARFAQSGTHDWEDHWVTLKKD